MIHGEFSISFHCRWFSISRVRTLGVPGLFGYLLASTTPGSIRKEMPEIPIFWGSEAIGYAPTWDDNFAPNGSEWVDEC